MPLPLTLKEFSVTVTGVLIHPAALGMPVEVSWVNGEKVSQVPKPAGGRPLNAPQIPRPRLSATCRPRGEGTAVGVAGALAWDGGFVRKVGTNSTVSSATGGGGPPNRARGVLPSGGVFGPPAARG